MEKKSDLHGCNDACCRALISSSGYIITMCALYRAPLLKTQMFNDVYGRRDCHDIASCENIYRIEREPRRGLTIDSWSRRVLPPKLLLTLSRPCGVSLSLSLPYSALGFRLINSLLHVPYLTHDCLIKCNNGPLSYTRGNCGKHVGELIATVIHHRVQVSWCLCSAIF